MYISARLCSTMPADYSRKGRKNITPVGRELSTSSNTDQSTPRSVRDWSRQCQTQNCGCSLQSLQASWRSMHKRKKREMLKLKIQPLLIGPTGTGKNIDGTNPSQVH